MGRPFLEELKLLPTTYGWALHTPIHDLGRAIKSIGGCSLVAVGSGGALTSAHFMAKLHQQFAGHVSKQLTPLEMLGSYVPRDCAVALVTAGGSNPDILAVCRRVAEQEPRAMLVICASKQTRISILAREYRWVDVFEYALPSGKDGFLATNSLLAFVTLLTRAYKEAFDTGAELAKEIMPSCEGDAPCLETAGTQQWELMRALKRSTLSVLYDGWGHPAASDLESKFTEAALANVQTSDYRNFAHGRHHWLAKHASHTGVLALVTPDCQKLADRTLKLVPDGIPVARITTKRSGPTGAIDLLVHVQQITSVAGEMSNIDPGRPGVPSFGRRIYHIGPSSYCVKRTASVLGPSQSQVCLERKFAAVQPLYTFAPSMGTTLSAALRAYVRKMSNARFAAIVCDYDGTLCPTSDRFGELPKDVVTECIRLLCSGLVLGVATGRGKSARSVLRDCLPRELWPHVIIGYYNGGEIACLHEEAPDTNKPVDPQIQAFVELARQDCLLPSISGIEVRPGQITFEPNAQVSLSMLYSLVREMTIGSGHEDLRVFCSGHSVDVLAPMISKTNVVRTVRGLISGTDQSREVLCIGDKGTWYGNDFDLLTEPYSLSVDQCSFSLSSGWNLAPRGHRGVKATLDYLRWLVVTDGLAQLSLSQFGVRRS